MLVPDHFQGGAGYGCCERIPTECGSMLTRLEEAEDGFICEHCRDGIKTSGEGFADDRHIWADILIFRREQLPGPTETGLDFICHKEDVILLTKVCNFFQISSRRDDDSPFAL